MLNILLCLSYITGGFIVTMETRQMSLTAQHCYFSLNFLLLSSADGFVVLMNS